MLAKRILLVLLLGALAASARSSPQNQTANTPLTQHVFFRVQVAASVPVTLHGRLLIFVKKGNGDKEIDVYAFRPEATWVAAEEVRDLAPGTSIEIDTDRLAYPKPFSALSPGDYEAQAVLDTDHTYGYSGRSPSNWISAVSSLAHWTPGKGAEPSLLLDRHPPVEERQTALRTKLMARVRPGVAQKEEFVSPLLSRFWGRSVAIRAWVILPPNYGTAGRERFPTVYWTHGFGANLDYCLSEGMLIRDRMEQGKMPPLIWVMLDESTTEGTHEFADSVNNGPWGTALTAEFLPYLEHKYQMGARRNDRFLNGHSSGGWATLQLEVRYPQIFGGTWSTSPDSSDFHDFTGPNLYAPQANLYRKPDGTAWPIVRVDGKVVTTMEQFVNLEEILGPYGGQMTSFDWVFSPKSNSGAPEPMFDRKTGAINTKVVAYWREHYDLAHVVETDWNKHGADWKGRIHLLVGTADTFYLDGAAHKFEAVLQRLGAEPHFSYLPNRTHFDLYTVGEDKEALYDRISTEMFAVARPHKKWKTKP